MATPLRIGGLLEPDKPFTQTVTQLRRLAEAGFAHAFLPQIFDHDALTILAAAGAQPRHRGSRAAGVDPRDAPLRGIRLALQGRALGHRVS